MKKVGQIGKYIVYKLDKDIARIYSNQITDLANEIPLVDYREIDILADYKKDRIFYGKWEHSLIVFDNKTPIAIIIAYERQSENNNLYPQNTIYISELAVKSNYRREGIARQLLKLWLELNIKFYHLKGSVNYSIQTNSADWNQYVINLYTSSGFVNYGMKEYPNRKYVILRMKPKFNIQDNIQENTPNPHKFYIELENTSKAEFDKLLNQSWTAVGVDLPEISPKSTKWKSTVDSPNRERDRQRIEKEYNLPEKGSNEFIFYDKNGKILSIGYERVVYGDHGPYIEFTTEQINWEVFVHHQIKGPASYYHEHYNIDKRVMLYNQFKTVHNIPNPPEGKYSFNNNRSEGYADYNIGRLYLDPDDLVIMKIDNLIEIFNQVRDIPYRIPLSLDETEGEYGGSCLYKVELLKKLLEEKDLKCRYRVCSFLWSELNLPEAVIKAQHNDNAEHVWLEVLIQNKWVILDPSWDIGLTRIFSINSWDGISDTKPAVKPIEIFDVDTSAAMMKFDDYEGELVKDLAVNSEFYKALNDYFETIRLK
jgi:ribosomal protein S18 acetylase RimI-like enzyme